MISSKNMKVDFAHIFIEKIVLVTPQIYTEVLMQSIKMQV